jgi:hypothetical protein
VFTLPCCAPGRRYANEHVPSGLLQALLAPSCSSEARALALPAAPTLAGLIPELFQIGECSRHLLRMLHPLPEEVAQQHAATATSPHALACLVTLLGLVSWICGRYRRG